MAGYNKLSPVAANQTITSDRENKQTYNIDMLHLPGKIEIFAGTVAPDGYLLCQGQAVSRDTYSDLFAACGTRFGVGNGITTFNVPNLQNRVPVGLGAAPFNTLGNTGGEINHTLSIAEMPAHKHTDGGHSYAGGGYSHNGANDSWNFADVTVETASAGGNGAHNNLQPYITLNFIIMY